MLSRVDFLLLHIICLLDIGAIVSPVLVREKYVFISW